MIYFASKLFLGLTFVGVVWTVGGENPLASSDSSDTSDEEEIEKAKDPKAKIGPIIMTQAERIDFLSTHNKIRNDMSGFLKHPQPPGARMLKMYWNAYLEASSISWSIKCCKDWKHGQTEMVKLPEFKSALGKYGDFIGQNIEWHSDFRKPTGASPIVKGYASETEDFTYSPTDSGTCKPGRACGHYTQIVWEDTMLVGCGYVWCGDRMTSTCNYLPGGNMYGHTQYKTGPACSLCASDNKYNFTECDGQLCVPKDRCSAVKECKVVDPVNCLCSESSYNEILNRMLNLNLPTGKKPSGKRSNVGAIHVRPPVTVLDLLLSLVAILLSQGALSGIAPGLP